jgi:hypothetical protein
MTNRMESVKKELEALTTSEDKSLFDKFYTAMFDEDVDGATKILIDFMKSVTPESWATLTFFFNKVMNKFDNIRYSIDENDEELDELMDKVAELVEKLEDQEDEEEQG